MALSLSLGLTLKPFGVGVDYVPPPAVVIHTENGTTAIQTEGAVDIETEGS